MSGLDESLVQCPYCWETISVSIDTSVSQQEYIEDCQVCCRPITLLVDVHGGDLISVTAKREDD
ncbi:MAG: CPXCG motif-containing cysteine-rich protein [Candidatus Lindowbacteria bacterium]|nr:CPXCG motif-containing cysteine-rich protein [Candidatus Lindowbacteria bacterium]